MARSRLTRAFAVLVLILAQAALGVPQLGLGRAAHAQAMPAASVAGHMAMAYGATAAASAQPMNHADCGQGSTSRHGGSAPRCPCCPDLPGGAAGAGCPAMAGCTASPASPSSFAPVALATVALLDVAPVASAPAAHDFIPDSPPPRA